MSSIEWREVWREWEGEWEGVGAGEWLSVSLRILPLDPVEREKGKRREGEG